MNTTAASSIRRDLIPIMIAILFVFFLFWFDEGKYDLSWVSNPGSWFFFLIYLGVGILVYFIYGMWNSKLGRGIAVTGHEPDPDLGAKGIQEDHSRG